jgi:hypothetical protein
MTTRPMSSSAVKLWEAMREALTDDSFNDVRQHLSEVVDDSRKVDKCDVEVAIVRLARATGYWAGEAFSSFRWVRPSG